MHARVNFLSPFLPCKHKMFCDSILQVNHFMGVTTSCVFCLSKDIEKFSTTSICWLLSNLFDVSRRSSLLLVPLHRVLLSFSLTIMTPLLNLCCYDLKPADLKNFVTSLPAHVKQNFSLYLCLDGGTNQSDKRKGKGSQPMHPPVRIIIVSILRIFQAILLVWTFFGLVEQTV